MTLRFGTKAETLERLRSRIRTAYVAPLVYFTVDQWRLDAEACRRRVVSTLGDETWIVRSSSLSEDGEGSSLAGAYLSVKDVRADSLEPAVEAVIRSYGEPDGNDQILIQPMLKEVIRAGVVFSHDPNTCSPYRVINWMEGASTDAVTGGQGGLVWQQAALCCRHTPDELRPVIVLVEEVLALMGQTAVDCEFAISRSGDGTELMWLLQARPLALAVAPESPDQQKERLEWIAQKVARGVGRHPHLIGSRSVFGVMPDWNPAEIIGIRPRPLALSLYRELVTDSIWAYQRHNYGYRNLRSFPLIQHFYGMPYVDVRVSFNSFIPAELDDGLADRLVDYYIDRLEGEPTLHDKVEFEIVYSCYTLDLPDRLQKLRAHGFSRPDCDALARSLRTLTNRVLDPSDGLWKKDAAKLETLNRRREALYASDADPVERIYWLLEDAKRYGTLPFAGLARAGFIAVQMLRSLVTVGILTQRDYDTFLASVSTVSGQMARDRAVLDRATFLSRYGHLRPGTYDIQSARYDEAPERYFDWSQDIAVPPPSQPFSLTLPQMRQLRELLIEHGLGIEPVELFDFLEAGIELRELAKFQFSRNLSDALALIGRYGEQLGFSRDDMAFVDLGVFRELYVGAMDPVGLIGASISQGRKRYEDTLRTSLPPVISASDDVWGFQWPDSSPNFITQKSVTAPVKAEAGRDALEGVIVCIPNADPGFDWLFAYPIAGLITAWGGVNSHMAIRAGEQGIPAIIGAGESLYRKWAGARRLHIDCACRQVEVLA